MSSPSRIYVPMDELWTMPVPVPVSLLVRDGELAWSCGQLALDAQGRVIAPDDLAQQSRQVCEYIETIVSRAGVPQLQPRCVVLYYVHRSAAERDQMVELFRERMSEGVLIDPVPVPYFYYDGVQLEFDLFAAAEAQHTECVRHGSASATLNRAEEQTWISLDLGSEPVDVGLVLVEKIARDHNLGADSLLADRWFAPRSDLEAVTTQLQGSEWCSDPDATVSVGSAVDVSTRALFTFVNTPGASGATETKVVDDVSMVWRTRGRFSFVFGRSLRANEDLVTQTTHIMKTIEQSLRTHQLDFTDVAKATANYVGDNTPESLHGNMNIRNDYYTTPGPASTGLPVDGFADDRSKIAIDLTLTSTPT